MPTPENEAKKQWLGRYTVISRRLWEKSEQIERLYSLETKITPTLSDMPKGGGSENKIEIITERIEDIRKQIAAELGQLLAVRNEIETAIQNVKDESFRELLELRYIGGFTWEQVAVRMNYTFRNITYMHGRALNAIKIK